MSVCACSSQSSITDSDASSTLQIANRKQFINIHCSSYLRCWRSHKRRIRTRVTLARGADFGELMTSNNQLIYVDSFPPIPLKHMHGSNSVWSPPSELQMYSLVTSYLKSQLISHRTTDGDAKITPNWAQLLIIFVFVCASQLGAFHLPVGLYWVFLRMRLCLIILITVYFNRPYIRPDQTASPPESFRYGAEIHFGIHANECSEILLFRGATSSEHQRGNDACW